MSAAEALANAVAPSTVRVTSLPNGLTVVTDRMTQVESVSLGIWVEAGTRHETPAQNGISHLLEHMAFKGTEKRSARAIAEEIEAVGGSINAHTARDHTAYYTKVLKEDAPLALDILADILQHPTFDPEELAREREVVVQEIGQSNDTPDDIIFDHFQATAYPGQSLGRPVLGTTELVRGFTRATLSEYMGENYGPSRMILSAAGNLEHDQLVGLASKAFADLSSAGTPAFEPASYVGGEFREERDLEQVHLVLGFEGVSYSDPDYFPAAVLSALFGGGMSSRLFQEVREARGLVYSIYSFSSSFADGGIFAVYAGTGESEVTELIPVICDEAMKVTQGISPEELQRARAQLRAGILMALESSGARCEQAARQLQTYGRPLTATEMIAKLDAVDETAVTRVASRLFASAPTFTAVGPLDRVEQYDRLRQRLG